MYLHSRSYSQGIKYVDLVRDMELDNALRHILCI